MDNNYIVYHLHDDTSLNDSTTKYTAYVDKAVELGQKSIAFTNHGTMYNWISKKRYCDKMGVKYIHGCEIYLTERLFWDKEFINELGEKDTKIVKKRDNYHTILLAKNYEGVKEINRLVSISSDSNHKYYSPRISFDEFINISDNVIKISSCLASPLSHYKPSKIDLEIESVSNEFADIIEEEKSKRSSIKARKSWIKANVNDKSLSLDDLCILYNNYIDTNIRNIEKELEIKIADLFEYKKEVTHIYNDLCNSYDYYEVQPHVNSEEQKEYNVYLYELSLKYKKPLIVGTDTHNIDLYNAECRTILKHGKGMFFSNEDDFDLTYKSYDEIISMFKKQGVLEESVYLQAIENTNVMASMVENFDIDTSFKYPKLYDDEISVTADKIKKMFVDKIDNKVIGLNQVEQFKKNIEEEWGVFNHVGMIGFMLFMSELIIWCHNNNIPTGTGRGSCFTKDNIVLTENGYKFINNISIGEKVYTHKGRLRTVTDTQKYNINEELYQFKYINQGSMHKKYPITCTKDHKFLIKRNYSVYWENAENMVVGDMLYYPYIERGYNCKESYKIRRTKNRSQWLPITEINKTEKIIEDVYDLTVEEDHSFIVNNIAAHNCTGSSIAYILDITDVNPVKWNTIFSRFCNKDRVELGDIDIDFDPRDRGKVYEYIFNKFGSKYSSYVLALGTVDDKGTIDLIGRGLLDKNGEKKYSLDDIKKVKREYVADRNRCMKKYKDIFYFMDGLNGTYVSQSMHPAGCIVSPIDLVDNYGTVTKDDMVILNLDMEDSHYVNLVKYDILSLENIGIIKDACLLANIPYPKSHEIDWNDKNVWENLKTSSVGLFQFETNPFSYKCLKDFDCKSVDDITLITACIRPSGKSYRDNLLKKEFHKNPSKLIDDMLADTYGFLCYQEQTILFLKDICGFSGSEADTIRRYIGSKNKEGIDNALPRILEGYCSVSDKPREVSEKEALGFLKIIEDSSSYGFGKNHAIAYSMITYMLCYLRTYYPYEFTTSYLNHCDDEEKMISAQSYSNMLKISINPPKFRYSKDEYYFDKESKSIYKGLASIKYISKTLSKNLYSIRNIKCNNFMELVEILFCKLRMNARQLDILIKIDFFSEFGSAKSLDITYNFWEFIKRGEIKQTELQIVEEIFPYMKNSFINNSVSTQKLIKITNIDNIINDFNLYISHMSEEDYSIKEKIKHQQDSLGEVSMCTNKPEDRLKIMILDIAELKKKITGVCYGYRILTMSLGTGKKIELQVWKNVYDFNKFEKYDMIRIPNDGIKKEIYNDRITWRLNRYSIINE